MRDLSFTKMHGLGNDFVVFDGIRQELSLSSAQIRFLANRHLGVGCDQLLLVERPIRSDVDFRYRIFNADGQEVSQCGNGARCFARFVRDQGLTTSGEIRVETASGIITLFMESDSIVRVNMGVPSLEPADIPFLPLSQSSSSYQLSMGGQEVTFSVVSMGNPHAVIIVPDVAVAAVDQAPVLQKSAHFPEGVNVGFMAIHSPAEISLRVIERGVGETLACGTGACAAVVAGRVSGQLADEVQVRLAGGLLTIAWQGVGTPVWMSGPTESVFEGQINLPDC
jgi:diaminopimelate epimerase